MASSDFMMAPDLASRSSWGGGATFLEWEISRYQASIVKIVLKKGMIAYERNIAMGKFKPPIEVNTFESGQEGRIKIKAENTGSSLNGQFGIGISICTNSTRGAATTDADDYKTCTADKDCPAGIKCTDEFAGPCNKGEYCVCNVIGESTLVATCTRCAIHWRRVPAGAFLDPFTEKPTRTLAPGEFDEVTFSVRASVVLGASYCCNATLKSAYDVVDKRRFCFKTTTMQRNFIGGDACDSTKEDCDGMGGMGSASLCSEFCPLSIGTHPRTLCDAVHSGAR